MLRHVLSRKFIMALWLAARRGASDHPLSTIADGWHVLLTLLKTLLNIDRQAPRWKVEQRLQACRDCPIYCPDLETCGDARTLDDKPLGCFCYLPVKARISSSVCWLHEPEQFGPECEGGWPKK